MVDSFGQEDILSLPDFEGRGKTSAVDRLVEEIRDMISERRLAIGDALPTERELSEQFQAGRNTVREALQVLRAYGIVETRPKVGAVISGGHGEALRRLFAFHNGISPDSFRDLQGFRRILETGVGEHIILNANSTDFDRLDTINARILDASSIEEGARCDYDFHAAIVELAGNRTTVAAYNMLRSVIEEVMRLGKADRPVHAVTHQAHSEIVDALRRRDRIAYVYLMSVHLEFGLRFVEDAASDKRQRQAQDGR